MQISCLPISFFKELSTGKMSIGEWARYGKDLGLDGIDISMVFLQNHTPVYLNSVKRELEEAGMSIVMATTYPDFTCGDPEQRKRELAYLVRDIAVCSQLGIRYLRVLAGQNYPGISRSEGVEWAVENLLAAQEHAVKFGVELVYEDHAKPGAWDYIDFSHPTDIFLEIAERLKGSGIGINYDTGNITAYGDDTLQVLPKVIDEVRTVHVSDMAERGCFSPVVIGSGVTPNRELFRLLRQHSYNGWLCIEEASGTGMEGIRKAVAFTREAWDDACTCASGM